MCGKVRFDVLHIGWGVLTEFYDACCLVLGVMIDLGRRWSSGAEDQLPGNGHQGPGRFHSCKSIRCPLPEQDRGLQRIFQPPTLEMSKMKLVMTYFSMRSTVQQYRSLYCTVVYVGLCGYLTPFPWTVRPHYTHQVLVTLVPCRPDLYADSSRRVLHATTAQEFAWGYTPNWRRGQEGDLVWLSLFAFFDLGALCIGYSQRYSSRRSLVFLLKVFGGSNGILKVV